MPLTLVFAAHSASVTGIVLTAVSAASVLRHAVINERSPGKEGSTVLVRGRGFRVQSQGEVPSLDLQPFTLDP